MRRAPIGENAVLILESLFWRVRQNTNLTIPMPRKPALHLLNAKIDIRIVSW